MRWNWEFQPLELMVYTVETDGSTCWDEDNLSFDKTENLRCRQFLLTPFKFAYTAPVIPMNREMQKKGVSV